MKKKMRKHQHLQNKINQIVYTKVIIVFTNIIILIFLKNSKCSFLVEFFNDLEKFDRPDP